MADILEFAKSDSTFTVADVLEDKLSQMLARMHDYMALRQNEEEKAIIESWRHDLVAIRRVIYNTMAANKACSGLAVCTCSTKLTTTTLQIDPACPVHGTANR